MKAEKTVLLVGNPNVGKSTIFNSLTGLKQHTGNWTGKTVERACGRFSTEKYEYTLIDLPGTYSLAARTREEEVTEAAVTERAFDAVIAVCDATCTERGLCLAMQAAKYAKRLIICINLIDEAERSGISIDSGRISAAFGARVITISARRRRDIALLRSALDSELDSEPRGIAEFPEDTEKRAALAERIAAYAVTAQKGARSWGLADRILTGKYTAFPTMALLLAGIFWLTVRGANYPSALLADIFSRLGGFITGMLLSAGAEEHLVSLLMDGIYGMVTTVVSVMLPPMLIFFPLFTIAEDLGYLPRVAFNLDRPFGRCGSCGKQSLTMCMGFGCNAVGVTGARIIDSERERLIAVITNSFVPCNGRFPAMIAIITAFFTAGAAFIQPALLTLLIVISVAGTLAATKLCSATLLRGARSEYALELPPFRRPQILKTLGRSVTDRTVFVLGRAVASAAPAGLAVWLMANIRVGGESILHTVTSALDPVAAVFGLDGVIVAAFILGITANETVVPIMIMAYSSLGTPQAELSAPALRELFTANGWNMTTAVCVLIFILFHSPCMTTLLTIKKETGSLKWTAVSFILPVLFGAVICAAINLIAHIFT